jgi:4-carboxymuconolactone decarboxylase
MDYREVVMAEQSRAQQLVGRIAPKLAELTDEVLFGDVWARPGLARRDRSLITVAALAALGRTEQLRSHLGLALDNGLSQEELAEAATHLAFYAGWPAGMTTATTLQEVLNSR